MFRFALPFSFLLLLPWAFALWRVFRRGHRRALPFAPTHRLPPKTASWRSFAARILPPTFLLGTLLLIIAAARPQSFFSRDNRTVDAIAIVMTVDVSNSMNALDLAKDPRASDAPTRLDVVKEMFAQFINRRTDDLIGLVAFGGYASTRSPLTADHRALINVLRATSIPRADFDENGIPVSQEELLTAIGDGLATACARLADAETKTKVVVLLSDGESNTGLITPEQAAAAAEKLGIRVYTIGVGANTEAPFKTKNAFGKDIIGYATVGFNEAQLRNIAETTHARYFNVRDVDGFRAALDEIDALETTRISRDVYFHYNERFLPFLALGATLCAAALLAGLFLIQRPI